MKIRKYLKENGNNAEDKDISSKEVLISQVVADITKRKLLAGTFLISMCIFICGVKVAGKFCHVPDFHKESDIQMISLPVTAATNTMSTISIPVGTVKANPFLPYKEIKTTVHDVPTTTLIEPPSNIEGDDEAIRVMDTVVSGILYDKYSPSAIINIDGVDYLVKKGDVVNNYKILNIMKNSVTVKLGANVYEAGIGEMLTSSSINKNTVSNLNKKFGGSKL